MVMARAVSPGGMIELEEHPFGKGNLTTDGVQYGAETANAGSAAYVAVPGVVTIYRPAGATIVELEVGLTLAVKQSSSVETALWKFQASDNNADWEDLIAEQIAASGTAVTAYADKTALGRFAPTGNFAGTTNPFYVRGVIKAGTGGVGTLSGKMKNSSYILTRCKLW